MEDNGRKRGSRRGTSGLLVFGGALVLAAGLAAAIRARSEFAKACDEAICAMALAYYGR